MHQSLGDEEQFALADHFFCCNLTDRGVGHGEDLPRVHGRVLAVRRIDQLFHVQPILFNVLR